MEQFVFSVDSALLGELGEKLVSSVHVALTELVKNAYDADANQVTIRILMDDNGLPAVKLVDDGSGMTLDEVRRYWMKIGTSNKQREPVSRLYGRPRTGAKGIGRFCCRRLGTKLKLRTTAHLKGSSFETTEIIFDWERFIPGTDVAKIKCKGTSVVEKRVTTGTTIEIYGATQNEWQQRGFDYLRRQLSVLASNRGAEREGYEPDLGFEIELFAPDFSGGIGDLREQVIAASWGTLTGEINEDDKAVCTLHAKGLGTKPKTIISRRKFPRLPGVTLKLGIMPLDRGDFRNPQVLSKSSAIGIAEEWGGVQLRYNGFRVIPYGDDDWLSIERDRARRLGRPSDELFDFAQGLAKIDPSRALLNMLSMRSYIGNIDFDNRASDLIIKADRQGLLENEAFTELRDFARFAIDWANIYRDYYVQSQITESVSEARTHLESVLQKEIADDELVSSAINYLNKEIRTLTSLLPEEEQGAKKELLLRTTRALEAGAEANLEKLRHLRLLASASTLTLLFSHEIKSLLGTLAAGAAALTAIEQTVSGKQRNQIRQIAANLSEAKARFSDLIEMTGVVGGITSEPDPGLLNLHEAVSKATKCFNLIMRSYDIDISYAGVPRDLAVGPIIQGELYAILLNVLSNAIKSVIAGGDRKIIAFDAKRFDKRVVINVRDTGVGLSEAQFEEVFKTFVSDPDGTLYEKLDERLNPQDAHLFGTGSGLGLSIVRDIVTARRGSIQFSNPPAGWKANLRITLP